MTIEDDFNQQTQAARLRFSSSIKDKPDNVARALVLEKHTGWPATSSMGDIDSYEETYRSQVGQHLIDNSPILQDFINSHPLNAGLVQDDLGNLDGVSAVIKRFSTSPLNDFFKGFGEKFDEAPPAAWQQNNPWWKDQQDRNTTISQIGEALGIPIDVATRTLVGVAGGVKKAAKTYYIGFGGSESQAEIFSNELAGLVEYKLMGMDSAHGPRNPREALKNKGKDLFGHTTALEDFEKSRVWAEAGKTPPVGISPLIDRLRAEQTEQDLTRLDDLVKAAQGTKLHQRHPPSLVDFIRLHPEIRDENVYISSEAVKKIYGDKKPELDDNLLGWVPEIESQLAAGGDVMIPVDLWATKIETELAKELKDFTKLRPDGLTLDDVKNTPEEKELVKEETENKEKLPSPLMQAVAGYRRAAGIELYPREIIDETGIVSAQVKPTELWSQKEKEFYGRMDKLLEKLAPRLVEGMHAEDIKFGESRAYGAYIPRSNAYPLIVWSAEQNSAHTIRHEIIHHLNRYGFFTDKEWETLALTADSEGWIKKHGIDKRYSEESSGIQFEESIAEEFAEWATKRDQAHPLAKIFQKIWDLIQGLRTALKETFGEDLSAEDLFRKVEKGEIGAREDNKPLPGYFNPLAQKEEDAAFQAKHDEEQRKKQSSKEWKDAASAMRGDAQNAILGRPDVQAEKFLREHGDKKWAGEQLDRIADLYGYQTRNEMLDAIYALREDRGTQSPSEYLDKLITDETNRRVGKKLNDPEALLESAKDHVISLSATDLQYELARITAAKTKEKLPSKKQMKQEVAEAVANLPLKMINSDKFLADAGRTTRVKDDLQSKVNQLKSIYKAQEARKYEKAKKNYDGIVRGHRGLEPKDIDIPHGLFVQQSLVRLGEAVKRTQEDLAIEIANNASGYKDINAFEYGKNTDEFKSINIGDNLRNSEFRIDKVDNLKGSDFLDVLSGLRSLVKSGRQDFKLEVRGKNEDAAQVIKKIGEQIAKQGEKKVFTNPDIIRRTKKTIETLGIGLRQVELLIDAIEKGNPFGDFTQSVIEPIYRASGILDDNLKKGSEVVKKLPLKVLEEKIENKLIIEPDTVGMATGPQFKDLRKKNLLAFILNMGEVENRKALLEGYKISEAHALAWIDLHVTKEIMEAAQKIWDWQKDIKTQQDAMFRREGDWVEPQARPVEIKTKHGTYIGGGVPLLYDARYEKSKILGPGAIEGASYVKAQMGPKEALPVSLDFERLINHTSGAIRDLSLRPALRQVARIFRDNEFRKAVRNHLGPEYNDLFDKWLFDIANQRNVDTRVQSALSNVSDFARTSLASYLIDFNLNTVEKHGITAGLQSLSRSIETQGLIKGPVEFLKDFGIVVKDASIQATLGKNIGKDLFSKEFANEFNLMLLNPDLGESNVRFAMEASYELPRRLHGWAENIGGATQELVQGRSLRQWIIGLGSKPIAIADLSTATALFITEFRAAQEKGLSKGDSVFLADRAVRHAHGSTALFTKPEFMRSSTGSKWMMTFYGFFNHILQKQFEIGWRSSEMYGFVKAGDTASAAKALGTITNLTFFYVIAPAIVEMYVAQELWNSSTKDEGFIHRLAKGVATSVAGSLPLVRDLAHYAAGFNEPNVGLAGTMLKNIGTPIVDLSKGKVFSTQKATEKFLKDFLVAVGSVTGVVPSAVVRAGKFVRDVQKGKEKPKGFVEWERGLQTGHAKPPKK